MTRLPSLTQLKKAVKLATELEKLQKELDDLCTLHGIKLKPRRAAAPGSARRSAYTLTPHGSKRIAEAQRRRWARFRREKKAAAENR